MSRIRTIKPEFWTSEQVMECTPLARLLFVGLWNFCDDQGVHPASSKTLKAEVFPGDDITSAAVEGLVQELIEQGLVATFAAEGKRWWVVTGWHHQLIKHPSAPKYPAPPARLPQSYPSPGVGLPQSYPSPTPVLGEEHPQEGKGREEEGKGKGREPIREGRKERARPQEEGPSNGKPKHPMTADWQPSPQALAILGQQGIGAAFADSCLSEFKLYWIERGDARPGWDASFVNSVKRSWEKRPPGQQKVLGQRRPGQTIAERITEEHALIFGARDPDPFRFAPKAEPHPIEGEVEHVH